ncbi:MAG: AAA family ATPase [Candidatus Beckwithbacteria bacterium]|nr:AAA family ATPase [Patescibacteria group bacterium]
MQIKKRYLTENIVSDLTEKMVFIAGPRQVGKTTLAQGIGKQTFTSFTYFNWDYQPDRKEIINSRFPAESKLIIYDELHKYKNWKNQVKGLFDKYRGKVSILVTGSAKLDVYRRGGDSLVGRYHFYLLHPFSLAEIIEKKNKFQLFKELKFSKNVNSKRVLKRLLGFGPFPEPYIKNNKRYWRRWQSNKIDRLVKEEIRDMRVIFDISNLQVLVEILPERAASLLSMNNLRGDLQVAHKTIVNYLNILESLYYHFRIYPFSQKTIRSLRKASKIYLWDWSVVKNQGAKFENLIASHLLKLISYLKNVEGYQVELFYLRDTDGREVDFFVVIDKKPWFAVEVKLNETKLSKPLLYFGKKLKIPYLYQVVLEEKIDFIQDGIRVISADKFLTGLV